MKKLAKLISILLTGVLLFGSIPALAYEQTDFAGTGFDLTDTIQSDDLGGTVYRLEHIKTGAEVIYVDNGAERLDFTIGFKTPPADNKGANHVLEHALFCGSEKYPVKNIMPYIRENAVAETLNGVTADDITRYEIKTTNETELYNLMDVYLNGIFHPLFLTDENIFKQQGIRLEYTDNGVQYNGVVYNELKLKSLDTAENSLSFIADSLYTSLYGDTAPALNSGGTVDALKELTYEDLLRVYHTYYVPSNSITYLAGKQDIKRTLSVLDTFFSESEKQEIPIIFEDTKQTPTETYSEYHITADTQTVDIGFMFSGVPMSEPAEEIFAREIIFNLIQQKMNEVNPNNYTNGGNAGGIANITLIASEVPIGEKDNVIAAYGEILSDFAENGFDKEALEAEIAAYFETRRDPYFYDTAFEMFCGVLYQDDPFAFTNLTTIEQKLESDTSFFEDVFNKYFYENPCRKIVVSGNGWQSTEEEMPEFSDEELKQIKADTEAFAAWAEAPDDPEAVAAIPSLTTDEVAQAPEYKDAEKETTGGIDFYFTEKTGSDVADLFFPIPNENDLLDLQLLLSFLNDRASQRGLSVGFGLAAMESYRDSTKINPKISMNLYGGSGIAADSFESVITFLTDETLLNEADLTAYVKSAPGNILSNGYRDPYNLSYELKQSSSSAGNAFYAATSGSIGQGSVPYYHYLTALTEDIIPQKTEKIRQLLSEVILGSVPTVEYVGERNGFDTLKTEVTAVFQSAEQKTEAQITLPVGYNSAAIITDLPDATHFMLSGNYAESGYTYSGKMNILGKVLTSKYMLPILRGRYGAYGAGVNFDVTGVTCSATGLSDIDLVAEVWQGMGDYLRNIEITQKEIEAIIVPAVMEFDMYYNDSDYGATMAFSEKTAQDIARTREEMLSVTVEDLRGYADMMDAVVSQGHIFAVTGIDGADSTAVDFGYYANANTLEVSPRLTKTPSSYITGKTEDEFCPDEFLTRAEAAALIARLTADKRPAQGNSMFSDVNEADWYYDAVVSLAEKGILSGYEDGTFRPNEQITRAEFAAMLSQFIYGDSTSDGIGYSDITDQDWFYDPVMKMADSGYLTGYEDQTMHPNDAVTRAEAVTILNRMTGKAYLDTIQNPFTDIEGHWAYEDILAACSN